MLRVKSLVPLHNGEPCEVISARPVDQVGQSCVERQRHGERLFHFGARLLLAEIGRGPITLRPKSPTVVNGTLVESN